MTRLTGDRRGVSTAVTSVLVLGITTILITGLIIGVSGFVEDQRRSTVDRELTIVGERMASELVRVDEMAHNDPHSSATVRTNHPDRVAGESYTVALTNDIATCGSGGEAPCLVLSAHETDVTVVVPIRLRMGVTDSETTGDGLQFTYDGSKLLVEEAVPV
jgi:hypothetical protein